MGSGEGNAAFGAGTYVAEYQGTGNFYMRQDMRDKKSQLGRLMRVDIAVTPEESLDWFSRIGDQPQIMEAFNNFPEEIRDGKITRKSVQELGSSSMRWLLNRRAGQDKHRVRLHAAQACAQTLSRASAARACADRGPSPKFRSKSPLPILVNIIRA